jgi:hypothetical protein
MPMSNFACTDLGNADRFIHRYGDKVRYLEDIGRWLFWDGTRWKLVQFSKFSVWLEKQSRAYMTKQETAL